MFQTTNDVDMVYTTVLALNVFYNFIVEKILLEII